jgi:hypothetical protein
MMNERGKEPIVAMYCYWAWEFSFLNEKVRRISLLYDPDTIVVQVVVLETIGEKQMEDIKVAHTNIMAQLSHVYRVDEVFIKIKNDNELQYISPLPMRVFSFADRKD